MSKSKIDWSSVVLGEGEIQVSPYHPIFRASDNWREYDNFRRLTRDGVPLDVKFYNEHDAPCFEIQIEGLHGEHPIWLSQDVEQFLLQYLLSGKNTDFPKTPPDGEFPEFKSGDDYIQRHIKREIERGKYTYKQETKDRINGIRFVGLYPYGSIDYGFMPYSWEQLNAHLESTEPFVYIYPEYDIPDLHYTDLPTPIELELAEDKHLDSVFTQGIPSNCIINKTICGCGATHMEIKHDRHSIIIEPNVPVIIGKTQQHDNLIGVYGEKIDKRDIAQKVQDRLSAGENVKIMTTPDSYIKTIEILGGLEIDWRNDCFLLFDECEKIISDIDYRPNVALPIDDFFLFKDKTMVSATPIIINDPRFAEQGFKVIEIKPQFDYKKPLELKPTNNVSLTVKRTLAEIDREAIICFFYNSVNGIEELIEYLGIPTEKANVYCSTKARKGLKKDGYNVFDSVTDKDGNISLNKYNFFTSRFYSAVDIKVDILPTVIMVTNVYKTIKDKTPYSFIDPETEAVQIAGRFRNGIERLIHITNTNSDTPIYTRAELEQYLNGQHDGFLKLVDLYNSVENTPHNGEKVILHQAVKRTDYYAEGFVDWHLKKNYFRYNNFYLDERLKMLYTYPAPLYKAYERSGAFTVISESQYVICTDEERRKLKDKSSNKAKRIKLLYDIIKRSEDSDNFFDHKFIQELKLDYPLYMEAFATIGYLKVRELEFIDSAIRTAVNDFIFNRNATSPKVIKAVYKTFKPNTIYSIREIKDGLKRIYEDNNVKMHRQPQGEDITLYFEATYNRTSRERGWKLDRKLY